MMNGSPTRIHVAARPTLQCMRMGQLAIAIRAPHLVKGEVSCAIPLFEEELEGMRKRYGDDHEETQDSLRNLTGLRKEIIRGPQSFVSCL